MKIDDTPNLTLIEEAAATPQLFERDGVPAPQYRFMRRVHSRNGETYCVISIFLDERVFRMAPRRFRRETVIPVLLDLRRVTVARKLVDVVAELNRWYGTDIKVPELKAHDRPASVDAPLDSLRVAIAQVENSAGVTFGYEGQTMVFRIKKDSTAAKPKK